MRLNVAFSPQWTNDPIGFPENHYDPSLFDENLLAAMEETRHRKYEARLATGKAAVVLAVARTLPQPFRLNDLSVAIMWVHAIGITGSERWLRASCRCVPDRTRAPCNDPGRVDPVRSRRRLR